MFIKKIILILIILIAVFSFCKYTSSHKNTGDGVPKKYQSLYNELDSKLDEINSHFASKWDGKKYSTTYCTELLVANSNRGEELLDEKTMKGVEFTLDKLKSLGVKGIVFNVSYPLIMPYFPRSSEYLDFYKKVASAAKNNGFTLIIETGTIFTDPSFSKVKVDYSDLTLEKFKKEKKQMVETIIKEIKPDYLTIENEPNTQHNITGLDFSVSNYTDILKYLLTNLDKNGVQIGAGAGTWDNLDYFKAAAEIQSIDYLDMHIYPVQRNFVVDKTDQVYELANTYNKKLTMSEAWLYKAYDKELNGIAGSEAKIFSRDVYSFWTPLDEKFITTMVKMCNCFKMEFCSFFWMQYFYGYLDYSKNNDGLPYTELAKMVNQTAVKNIVTNTLSETGKTYQNLIK